MAIDARRAQVRQLEKPSWRNLYWLEMVDFYPNLRRVTAAEMAAVLIAFQN